MAWDDRWRTGHNVFDLDHKQLATLLDLLADSLSMLPGAYPVSMAQRLVLEAREHFRREEECLLRHPSDEADRHVAQHRAFIGILEALERAVTAGDASAAARLIDEAHTMFVEDLLPADAAMVSRFAERTPTR